MPLNDKEEASTSEVDSDEAEKPKNNKAPQIRKSPLLLAAVKIIGKGDDDKLEGRTIPWKRSREQLKNTILQKMVDKAAGKLSQKEESDLSSMVLEQKREDTVRYKKEREELRRKLCDMQRQLCESKTRITELEELTDEQQQQSMRDNNAADIVMSLEQTASVAKNKLSSLTSLMDDDESADIQNQKKMFTEKALAELKIKNDRLQHRVETLTFQLVKQKRNPPKKLIGSNKVFDLLSKIKEEMRELRTEVDEQFTSATLDVNKALTGIQLVPLVPLEIIMNCKKSVSALFAAAKKGCETIDVTKPDLPHSLSDDAKELIILLWKCLPLVTTTISNLISSYEHLDEDTEPSVSEVEVTMVNSPEVEEIIPTREQNTSFIKKDSSILIIEPVKEIEMTSFQCSTCQQREKESTPTTSCLITDLADSKMDQILIQQLRARVADLQMQLEIIQDQVSTVVVPDPPVHSLRSIGIGTTPPISLSSSPRVVEKVPKVLSTVVPVELQHVLPSNPSENTLPPPQQVAPQSSPAVQPLPYCFVCRWEHAQAKKREARKKGISDWRNDLSSWLNKKKGVRYGDKLSRKEMIEMRKKGQMETTIEESGNEELNYSKPQQPGSSLDSLIDERVVTPSNPLLESTVQLTSSSPSLFPLQLPENNNSHGLIHSSNAVDTSSPVCSMLLPSLSNSDMAASQSGKRLLQNVQKSHPARNITFIKPKQPSYSEVSPFTVDKGKEEQRSGVTSLSSRGSAQGLGIKNPPQASRGREKEAPEICSQQLIKNVSQSGSRNVASYTKVDAMSTTCYGNRTRSPFNLSEFMESANHSSGGFDSTMCLGNPSRTPFNIRESASVNQSSPQEISKSMLFGTSYSLDDDPGQREAVMDHVKVMGKVAERGRDVSQWLAASNSIVRPSSPPKFPIRAAIPAVERLSPSDSNLGSDLFSLVRLPVSSQVDVAMFRTVSVSVTKSDVPPVHPYPRRDHLLKPPAVYH